MGDLVDLSGKPVTQPVGYVTLERAEEEIADDCAAQMREVLNEALAEVPNLEGVIVISIFKDGTIDADWSNVRMNDFSMAAVDLLNRAQRGIDHTREAREDD